MRIRSYKKIVFLLKICSNSKVLCFTEHQCKGLIMLTTEIKRYLKNSVLCWLATSSNTAIPNVSPKEIFLSYGDTKILVANIASPKTVRNIQKNPCVCISFINVFIQKGYKIQGQAKIIKKSDSDFMEKHGLLKELAGEKFSIQSIIEITATSTEPIIAPSYRFYPETNEQEQIQSARISYGVVRKKEY